MSKKAKLQALIEAVENTLLWLEDTAPGTQQHELAVALRKALEEYKGQDK